MLYNLQHYKDRNHIERMFNKLKPFRRIATRYDKARKSFLAFLHIAATSHNGNGTKPAMLLGRAWAAPFSSAIDP
ncbi:MAG: hypothetical protein ABF760_07195 [Zymomonas mobilis]